MKIWYLAIIFAILIGGLVTPVIGVDTSKYSYINVECVDISLVNNCATINISYTIDDGAQWLVLLLGNSDLKNKLNQILNYENGKFIKTDMDHAIFEINDGPFDYGDGSYWFPEHEFGITIPALYVRTQQSTRNYTMTAEFPNGMGYFET